MDAISGVSVDKLQDAVLGSLVVVIANRVADKDVHRALTGLHVLDYVTRKLLNVGGNALATKVLFDALFLRLR